MNRKLKLSIFLLFFMCVILTGIAYASETLNTQVLFNCMNITINGEKVDMDNLVYSNEYGDSATLIRDEKIRSGKEFTINCKINLNQKEFITDKTYKVVFLASFEMKTEKKKYKLCEEAYFKLS